MTTAGNTLGTVAYMAPERFEAGYADPRSDVYALTCVLYECLTASRPYPADSLEQQITRHLVSPPPRPSATEEKLAAFDDVIAKGMAKESDERYQTAGDLAAAARRALNAPVRRAGGSRHSAQRARTPARRVSRRALAVAGAAVLLVAGCALGAWLWWGKHEGGSSLPQGADPAIAATVPKDIRATGRLVIGVNVPYAPNEFKNSDGQIVGFDVDVMNAMAKTLGLAPDYRETAFESIIPSVQGGQFNVGMSSLTDTAERQSTVDFVTYFQAGTLWAQRPGKPVDPDAACGRPVGVVTASIQETKELPTKSDACVAAGLAPIDTVVYQRQDDLTHALIAGEVDAMTADSPVTGFAIKLSAGELEPAGAVFDSAPYGWPVAKGSPLAQSLRKALEHLMQSGEYRTIATMWGVDKGMIDKPAINGAIR